MPRSKDLKKIVRERMAKTGERKLTVTLAPGAVDDERSRTALAYMQRVVDEHADEILTAAEREMFNYFAYGPDRRGWPS